MDQPNQGMHNSGAGHHPNDQQQHMDMLNGMQMPNQQQPPNAYPNYMPPPGSQNYWPMGHNELPSTSNGYSRMVNGGGVGRPMPPIPNPHYYASSEQMSMPGAVSSPSVTSSSALEYQGGMPGGSGGSPVKNGVAFSPSGYGQMANGGAGGARNGYVFSTEMANRAVSEVAGKRYENMVHWHMANAGVSSTSTCMPCRSPLDGAYGGIGSPGAGGLPSGTNGRGTKRKASAPIGNTEHQQLQQQTPSPHHLANPMSNGKPMQGDTPSSVPDTAAMLAINNNNMNGMAPQPSDFLRPSNASSVGGHYTPSQDDDNPLKRIEAMTKLCDPTPINVNGNKMSRIASSTDLPEEAAAAQSKEQKLAKLEAINKFMSTTPEFGNQANNLGMRRPAMFLPPGIHAPGGGMPPNQPSFDPQLAAMIQQRQQQAGFYGPPPPNGMAWNGVGQPPMMMGPNGSISSHSPSFNPLNQPNGPIMMAGGMTNPQQPQFGGGGGPGMPMGGPGQMFSAAHMAAMQQHMRMAQPNQQQPFPSEMRAGTESGYWPPQHHMPQPLANLDTRVPVQKMQYFPNTQMGQPQQPMASSIPQ